MPRSALACLAIAVLLTGAIGGVSADDTQALAIDSTRIGFGVSTENRWIMEDLSPAGSSVNYESGHYTEEGTLGITGSVYHPNLMVFALDTALGLSQQTESGDGAYAFNHVVLSDMNFVSNWLAEKPYGVSLFASKGQNQRSFQFFEREVVRETSLGAFGYWTNDRLPMHSSFKKKWLESERSAFDLIEEELVFDFGSNGTSRDGGGLTRLDYTYSDILRDIVGVSSQTSRIHDVRLADNYRFGKEGFQSLSSSLRYLNLTGSRWAQNLNLSESLGLQHTPSFASRYSYDLSLSEAPGFENRADNGRILLSHQLYESLNSQLSLHGSQTLSTDRDETTLGAGTDFRYRKSISVGFLNLNYSVQADSVRRETSAQTVFIVDEVHVLTDGVVTLLDNPKIDLSSVEVTDTSGSTLYLQSIDYSMTPIGERVQLVRIPAGSIPDGGTVHVDYITSSGSSSDYVRLGQGVGAGVDLWEDRLRLKYRYTTRQYPRRPENEDLVLESLNGHLVTLDCYLPPFNGGVEYENVESSVLSQESLRARLGLALPIGDRAVLDLEGSQSFVRLGGRGGQQVFVEATGEIRVRPLPSLELSGAGGFRTRRAKDADTTIWKAESGLSFVRGLLNLEVGYEYKWTDTLGADEQTHFLYTSLQRTSAP